MGTRRNYQRTSNKNDSPLHVLPVAERLIDYTLDLTDNAKRFPKRVRFSITNKIQDHVMAIYDDLLEAILGLSRLDCPSAKTGRTVNGGT